jgi:small subunit ribosomal protein S10
MTQKTKIRILLKSYDSRSLDGCSGDIAETATRTGARVAGPVPMPVRIHKVTVNRSPHVDKKSMDQFEQRIHKRLLDIYDPNANTIEALKKLNIPAGIEITIETQ